MYDHRVERTSWYWFDVVCLKLVPVDLDAVQSNEFARPAEIVRHSDGADPCLGEPVHVVVQRGVDVDLPFSCVPEDLLGELLPL